VVGIVVESKIVWGAVFFPVGLGCWVSGGSRCWVSGGRGRSCGGRLAEFPAV
jgi:hypothetical protein